MPEEEEEVVVLQDGLVILTATPSDNNKAVEPSSKNESPFMTAYELAVEMDHDDPIIVTPKKNATTVAINQSKYHNNSSSYTLPRQKEMIIVGGGRTSTTITTTKAKFAADKNILVNTYNRAWSIFSTSCAQNKARLKMTFGIYVKPGCSEKSAVACNSVIGFWWDSVDNGNVCLYIYLRIVTVFVWCMCVEERTFERGCDFFGCPNQENAKMQHFPMRKQKKGLLVDFRFYKMFSYFYNMRLGDKCMSSTYATLMRGRHNL